MTTRGIDIAEQFERSGAGVADDTQWLLKLRDGSTVDGYVADSIVECLRAELKRTPGLVEQLHDHATGRRTCPKELRDELVGAYFGASGRMQAAVKSVLLSGAERTDEGIRLIDPYDRSDEHTNLVLRTMAENKPIHEERFLRELLGDDRSGRRR